MLSHKKVTKMAARLNAFTATQPKVHVKAMKP